MEKSTLDIRKLPSLKRETVTFYDENDKPVKYRLKSKDDLDEKAQRYLFGQIVIRDADDALEEATARMKFMFYDDIPVEYIEALTLRQKEEIQHFFMQAIGKPIHVVKQEMSNVKINPNK